MPRPTDFLSLAACADAWGTDPFRILKWMGLDAETFAMLEGPPAWEAATRIHDAHSLAKTMASAGIVPNWTGFLATPAPGCAGMTFATCVETGKTALAIDCINAAAAGVYA